MIYRKHVYEVDDVYAINKKIVIFVSGKNTARYDAKFTKTVCL